MKKIHRQAEGVRAESSVQFSYPTRYALTLLIPRERLGFDDGRVIGRLPYHQWEEGYVEQQEGADGLTLSFKPGQDYDLHQTLSLLSQLPAVPPKLIKDIQDTKDAIEQEARLYIAQSKIHGAAERLLECFQDPSVIQRVFPGKDNHALRENCRASYNAMLAELRSNPNATSRRMYSLIEHIRSLKKTGPIGMQVGEVDAHIRGALKALVELSQIKKMGTVGGDIYRLPGYFRLGQALLQARQDLLGNSAESRDLEWDHPTMQWLKQGQKQLARYEQQARNVA